MLQSIHLKREEFRQKIRRSKVDHILKTQRQQLISLLEGDLQHTQPHPIQSPFKALGQSLFLNHNLLDNTFQQILHPQGGVDYAWCTSIVLKVALTSNNRVIVEKLISIVNTFLDENNGEEVVELGLKCCILILWQWPELIAELERSDKLIKFYYQGKRLKTIVGRVVIGFLSIEKVSFHHRLANEEYFEVISNILQRSPHRNDISEVLINLFCSLPQLVELYFPIFEALMDCTHLHPTCSTFILWRVIILQSHSCFGEWMIEKGFVDACMDVFRAPLDKERILSGLECIEVLFQIFMSRIIAEGSGESPEEMFSQEGLVPLLSEFSQSKEIYSQVADRLLSEYYHL